VPRRLAELSHLIRPGMVTYPGLHGPELGDHLARQDSPARYGPGTEFHIGRISMVANTGTYVDSPFHTSAQHGADPDGQIAPAEGLGHILVGAYAQPDRLVHLGVLGAEHDHRHVRPFA
jgi:kynurenine formamidase